MVDAEMVIKGMEKIYESYVDSEIIERHDYGDTRTADIFKQNASIIHDALELLKAQEPRVMALEEVERLSYEPVYYESKIIPPRWAIIEMNLKQDIQMLVSSGRVQCDKSSYGKRWRYWTSRPTDAQREATPWK